jgi:hypothetical protein
MMTLSMRHVILLAKQSPVATKMMTSLLMTNLHPYEKQDRQREGKQRPLDAQ